MNVENLAQYIQSCKNKEKLYKIWRIFLYQHTKVNFSGMKVLILNAPCMGFGDVVFAMKFSGILKKWYNCTVKIATTQSAGFISLGEKPENLISLESKSKEKQCRRFNKMFGNFTETFDIIFVAPLTADFYPDYVDIKNFLPYSNKFNTFFVSEYNDSSRKKIDFPTGIGHGRYGILLTEIPTLGKPDIKNPYALIYVAESLARVKSCILNFIEMVSKKYMSADFEIIIPSWATEFEKKIGKIGLKYYNKVVFKTTSGEKIIEKRLKKRIKNILYIRFDILPVKNLKMLELINYSVKDILLTGDQSITDAIACCPKKNIFYQIAPWKEDFGKKLAEELPNKWLRKKSQSCGSLKAIKYDGDYISFRQRWDFRRLARPKMDAIFLMNYAIHHDGYLKEYVSDVLKSKNIREFLHKYNQKYVLDAFQK